MSVNCPRSVGKITKLKFLQTSSTKENISMSSLKASLSSLIRMKGLFTKDSFITAIIMAEENCLIKMV